MKENIFCTASAETAEEMLERRHRELLEQKKSLESDIKHLEEQLAMQESGRVTEDAELEEIMWV